MGARVWVVDQDGVVMLIEDVSGTPTPFERVLFEKIRILEERIAYLERRSHRVGGKRSHM